jgi:hypothetical protein
MLTKIFAAASMALLLTGCGLTGRATDTACVAFGPIYVSQQDTLTDGTAEQILAHNLTGKKLCGW